MATLIPSLEKILKFKVTPEPGELHLLKYLDKILDSSYEVFFNPFLNGDRPDVVIMKKGLGVLIIEVKDYHLNKYELDSSKNLIVKSTNTKTYKSPVSQAQKYKSNLFELHIEGLYENKIRDIKNFNIVNTAIYFHYANEEQINSLFITPYKHDDKYMTFLKYNVNFIGHDTLNKKQFDTQFKSLYFKLHDSRLFTDKLYNSFSRFLNPPLHLTEQGKEIRYSKKQLELIYESNKKQQRIKGVVGSGKTTVLAARAV